MDSVSNISSKRSTKAVISWMRQNWLLLLVPQQTLKMKHALEKECLELEMKLAASVARAKVYKDVDLESHASSHRIVSKHFQSDVEPCVPSTSVQAAATVFICILWFTLVINKGFQVVLNPIVFVCDHIIGSNFFPLCPSVHRMFTNWPCNLLL